MWNQDSLGYGMESGWCTLHCKPFSRAQLLELWYRVLRISSVPVTHEGWSSLADLSASGPHKLIALSLIGASAASPTLVVKTENCLYIYIYTFGTYVFRIYTSYPICARYNISILHCEPLLLKRQDKQDRKAKHWNQCNRDL